MTTGDAVGVLALIIGIWGAVLSTYLAIRERRKDKRTLLLQFINSYEQSDRFPNGAFAVTNIGFRPATIRYVLVEVFDVVYEKNFVKKKKTTFINYLPKPENGTLPLTLGEAAVAVFPIQPLRNPGYNWLEFRVKDAEGHEYKLDADFSLEPHLRAEMDHLQEEGAKIMAMLGPIEREYDKTHKTKNRNPGETSKAEDEVDSEVGKEE